jgi:U3 small nucleolar RNA-associated protein 12
LVYKLIFFYIYIFGKFFLLLNLIIVFANFKKKIDFGNCHKSIFGHQDSITQIRTVKDTHYFFSASKDCSIKYWDGDTYQLISVFENIGYEVWGLGLSQVGDFFVSGSNDKCLRVYKQGKN